MIQSLLSLCIPFSSSANRSTSVDTNAGGCYTFTLAGEAMGSETGIFSASWRGCIPGQRLGRGMAWRDETGRMVHGGSGRFSPGVGHRWWRKLPLLPILSPMLKSPTWGYSALCQQLHPYRLHKSLKTAALHYKILNVTPLILKTKTSF